MPPAPAHPALHTTLQEHTMILNTPRIARLAALCALTALGVCAAQANTLDLTRYAAGTIATYALDPLSDRGLEASAVTWARDRQSLFFVGDEGLGVVEISRTGTTLGSMAFDWAGTGSTHNDAEGLTYIGNGQLVVVDERPQIAYRFDYANGGSVALNGVAKVALTGSTASVGNVGTEGISVDLRDGTFFSVKQDNPAQLRGGALSFAVGGGTSAMATLFTGPNSNSSLFGLNSLSDLQTLSGVDALTGTAAADHLLILSVDSRKLIEIDRAGVVRSSLDLAGLTTQAIEGVTIDERGVIYLVAESAQAAPSQLIVLTPVPEPGTWPLMVAGLLGLGTLARRKQG